MNIFLATRKALKLPVKLLVGLRSKRKKTELAEKCEKHVRNFAPTHYSWQKSLGKYPNKKPALKKPRQKFN